MVGFVGFPELFAAEPPAALEVKSLGQLLPLLIAGGFALGVVVGLLMSRNKSAGTAQVQDESTQQHPRDAFVQGESGQPQPPETGVVRNALWGLILPGLGVLVVGGLVFGVVIPLFQDLSQARDNFRSNMVPPTAPLPVQIQTPPIPTPQFQFKQPQIEIPAYKPYIPPPPKIPQTYIDRKGFIRTR